MKIIGLCGYSGVGKDMGFSMAIKWLYEQKQLAKLGRMAFADILKKQVESMLAAVGIDAKMHRDADKKLWRDMLVFWGRKRRELERDYWIDRLKEGIDYAETCNCKECIVITDVRYLNEVRAIEFWGGEVYRLDRPGYTGINEEETTSIEIIDKECPHLKKLVNDKSPEELGAALALIISGE